MSSTSLSTIVDRLQAGPGAERLETGGSGVGLLELLQDVSCVRLDKTEERQSAKGVLFEEDV